VGDCQADDLHGQVLLGEGGLLKSFQGFADKENIEEIFVLKNTLAFLHGKYPNSKGTGKLFETQ
jgi:hypothetical protein